MTTVIIRSTIEVAVYLKYYDSTAGWYVCVCVCVCVCLSGSTSLGHGQRSSPWGTHSHNQTQIYRIHKSRTSNTHGAVSHESRTVNPLGSTDMKEQESNWADLRH